jgi:hypothetical protein
MLRLEVKMLRLKMRLEKNAKRKRRKQLRND